MYYVDRRQIEQRLAFLPKLEEACRELTEHRMPEDPIRKLALERALHLALETVTDVGSLLIDGFIMRDASSYEDIITILQGESVFADELAAPLIRLVRMRKLLVQDYTMIEARELFDAAEELPGQLRAFAAAVVAFMEKEAY